MSETEGFWERVNYRDIIFRHIDRCASSTENFPEAVEKLLVIIQPYVANDEDLQEAYGRCKARLEAERKETAETVEGYWHRVVVPTYTELFGECIKALARAGLIARRIEVERI